MVDRHPSLFPHFLVLYFFVCVFDGMLFTVSAHESFCCHFIVFFSCFFCSIVFWQIFPKLPAFTLWLSPSVHFRCTRTQTLYVDQQEIAGHIARDTDKLFSLLRTFLFLLFFFKSFCPYSSFRLSNAFRIRSAIKDKLSLMPPYVCT